MRVVISGGGGLIGRALSAELLGAGHDVVILSRTPQRVDALPKGVRAVAWDGKTAQGWAHVVDGAGAVVNLAGENIAGEGFFPARWTEERKRRILSSRLSSGKAIVQAIEAAQQKPGVLLQASAIGYYGPLGDQPVDESSPAGSDFMARVCQEWEDSTGAVEAIGVRRVVLRTGVVLSMQGGAFTRLLMPFKFFAGGPMGNGRQYLSWIHMADQVAAMRFLIEHAEAQGVYNLTAPEPVSNAAFVRSLGKVMGRPSFLPVPGFALRMLFGEVATVVLDGQCVLPQRLQQLGYAFQFAQAEAAIRDLLKK